MRLIDADALGVGRCNKDVLPADYCTGWNGLIDIIENAPTIDAVEVVHGQWYMLDDCANAGLYCSACGRRVHREEFAYKKLKSKYCPHCGAKMDGREK